MSKKKIYLGINKEHKQCCIIFTGQEIKTILKNPISSSKKFKYSSTNWMGHDDTERTLGIYGIRIKAEHKLKSELVYSGIDYDMGHEYPFNFEYDTIAEVETDT